MNIAARSQPRARSLRLPVPYLSTHIAPTPLIVTSVNKCASSAVI